MSSLEAEIDANFYNLVHQLSMAAGGPPAERRHERRSRFVATQRVAFRRTPGIPDETEFTEVQCHDLTRGGFSFFLPSEPKFQLLVVALGTPPNLIHVSARVTHTEPVLVYESGLVERYPDGCIPDGTKSRPVQRRVLVGCTFVERLDASRQPSLVVE